MDAQTAARLEHDGYVIVPDALDRHQIESLLSAFEAAPPDGGTQHVRIDDTAAEHEAWRSLTRHEVIVEAAAQILGNVATAGDVHGRNPLPGYGQQGLHADWLPRSRDEPFTVVTAIVMLDAFSADNGATRIVPGTHLIPTPIPKSYAQPLARHPDELLATGAGGSILIINGHLWHSGTRNASRGPRRAAQVSIRRAGAQAIG